MGVESKLGGNIHDNSETSTPPASCHMSFSNSSCSFNLLYQLQNSTLPYFGLPNCLLELLDNELRITLAQSVGFRLEESLTFMLELINAKEVLCKQVLCKPFKVPVRMLIHNSCTNESIVGYSMLVLLLAVMQLASPRPSATSFDARGRCMEPLGNCDWARPAMIMATKALLALL